ncbi:MAG: hypothetical protein ACI8PD_001723 [Nitrospinales bacterium]|jgi:hypothetical protein
MIYEYEEIYPLFVVLMGITILLAGILMIVLSGPAIIVIPAGLAILTTEFAWARIL